MAVEFYNVKKRAKVQIDDSKITKVKWGENLERWQSPSPLRSQSQG